MNSAPSGEGFDWAAEEAAQSQMFATAIQATVNMLGDRLTADGRPPLTNALVAAHVEILGNILASVEDAKVRKALRAAVDREITAAMRRQKGKGGQVDVVVVDERRH